GVEHYAESMKLAMEAYADAMNDKERKDRSFEPEDEFSYAKLQEAYRNGNLDLLDTIGRVNSMSAAFDEKFLYRRNEIQASSIDSIIRSGSSLFVGVGAAHLPGGRGVIEMLRQLGYTLRPIKMGSRSSHYKDELEGIKVPVQFISQASTDGFYTVEAPGKLQSLGNSVNGFHQVQYADMANGSYYTITRVQTNAASWGHDPAHVVRKVDSLLYENIPGKIISKGTIVRNGYEGFSIINKTRRGDYQRYQVYVTPFEVLFFKMSGSGEFLKDSLQSQRFFKSIRLKGYQAGWKKFAPAFGGFEVEMPHEPYTIKTKHWQFIARDKSTGIEFSVMRTDVHQYEFTEHDSIDLNLLEESFTTSEFYDQTIRRQHTRHGGYAALDAVYRYKDGSIATARFLVQGPHYYTLLAVGKQEHPEAGRFINSFKLLPFKYPPARKYVDTSLHFTVTSPYIPEQKKAFQIPRGMEEIYLREGQRAGSEKAVYKDLLLAHDSTGEKIYVSSHRMSKYYEASDEKMPGRLKGLRGNASEWVIKQKKEMLLPSGMKLSEFILSDSLSSRAVWTKIFYKNGVNFTIQTLIDTLTGAGSFQTAFFESFLPADTIEGINPLAKKSSVYFEDLFHSDSSKRQRALNSLESVRFDATDLPLLKKAIATLNWNSTAYLDRKKDFLYKLGTINSPEAANYLKEVFYNAGDTIELQYAALESLLKQKTRFSFQVFKDILINDPPVLNTNASFDQGDNYRENDLFFDALYDSLGLTATIIKDIIPLLNVDDYKYPMLKLMAALADSSLLPVKDYEAYIPRFLLEAKQALKKQLIAERKKAISDAERELITKGQPVDRTFRWDGGSNTGSTGVGNALLDTYSILLMPFWDKASGVPQLLNQILTSTNKNLKYKTALLFLRNDKPLPDSLLPFFAAMDEYRYRLYKDLEEANKSTLFPAKYNNHFILARGKLVSNSVYNKPDSIIFLQALPVESVHKSAVVYFFKYKRKKDDNYWKIASAGPVRVDQPGFADEFELYKKGNWSPDFTEFSDTRLREDEDVAIQLGKKLRGLLLLQTKGGRYFYAGEDDQKYSIDFDEVAP
ncbi:MAG TPA: TraB/GumN family protein, partial [Chitinophagaceae bacterium]|nr:TraB/GumN family protein [Chitinophagaceae bacterium]